MAIRNSLEFDKNRKQVRNFNDYPVDKYKAGDRTIEIENPLLRNTTLGKLLVK